jgi:hypothetical protein
MTGMSFPTDCAWEIKHDWQWLSLFFEILFIIVGLFTTITVFSQYAMSWVLYWCEQTYHHASKIT